MKTHQTNLTSDKNDDPTPRDGKIRYALAAMLLGLPLPFVLLALIFRGCDW